MLGQTLVTHQTGAAGRVVNTVLVAKSVEIEREIYFAILLDRATGAPMIVASTEGGVEIEAVAEKTPEKIIREPVDRLAGLAAVSDPQAGEAAGVHFGANQSRLDSCSMDSTEPSSRSDCSMVEVNPLVVTDKGEVLALDAKFNFDDNALYRHPEVAALRDVAEEDPREVEASKYGLNYIGLDGNIACLVNGAGLAMATMDIIKFYGGSPANFLDVGGGATEEQVTQAFKLLVSDENVKAILVNIFGGIMKCDVIAQGIVNAVKAVNLPVPLVVRLEGTNVEAGQEDYRGVGTGRDRGGRSRRRGAESSKSSGGKMKITQIAFIGIPVTDMKRAREFYEGVLGLQPDPEMTSEMWTEYSIGEGTLAVACIGDQWKPSDQGTSAALEVENLEEAIARLEERKVKFEKFDSPVCRMAAIQDPDGNKLVIHKLKTAAEKGGTA